jgi:subtilase family serine protease
VVAVGGTTLKLDGQNTILDETGWNGSGGGISQYEAQPAYQKGVVTQSATRRTTPDVAYDADSNTGFAVYDSFSNGPRAPWSQVGGTSAAAPQWAALIAIADQGRALIGQGPLDGVNDTLTALYKLPAADFHDITTGSNSDGQPIYSAGPGYDLVTGQGTPLANRIVGDLVGNTGSSIVGLLIGSLVLPMASIRTTNDTLMAGSSFTTGQESKTEDREPRIEDRWQKESADLSVLRSPSSVLGLRSSILDLSSSIYDPLSSDLELL